MGRPRAFDRDEALMKAVDVFWNQGFEATSMTDLQKALGIGRQSLYDTFGDKRALFEEALDRYVDMGDEMLESVLPPDAGAKQIREHFTFTVHRLTQGEPRMGCLMMRTCMERAQQDPKAAEMATRGLATMRRLFARALTNAKARGEVPASTDAEETSGFLVSQIAGLSVLAGSGASPEDLLRVVDVALAAVGID